MKKRIWMLFLSLLFLSGCVQRNVSDEAASFGFHGCLLGTIRWYMKSMKAIQNYNLRPHN